MEAKLKKYPAPNNPESFADTRALLRKNGGSRAVLDVLRASKFVDEDGQLTTGTNPFNVLPGLQLVR